MTTLNWTVWAAHTHMDSSCDTFNAKSEKAAIANEQLYISQKASSPSQLYACVSVECMRTRKVRLNMYNFAGVRRLVKQAHNKAKRSYFHGARATYVAKLGFGCEECLFGAIKLDSNTNRT